MSWPSSFVFITLHFCNGSSASSRLDELHPSGKTLRFRLPESHIERPEDRRHRAPRLTEEETAEYWKLYTEGEEIAVGTETTLSTLTREENKTRYDEAVRMVSEILEGHDALKERLMRDANRHRGNGHMNLNPLSEFLVASSKTDDGFSEEGILRHMFLSGQVRLPTEDEMAAVVVTPSDVIHTSNTARSWIQPEMVDVLENEANRLLEDLLDTATDPSASNCGFWQWIAADSLITGRMRAGMLLLATTYYNKSVLEYVDEEGKTRQLNNSDAAIRLFSVGDLLIPPIHNTIQYRAMRSTEDYHFQSTILRYSMKPEIIARLESNASVVLKDLLTKHRNPDSYETSVWRAIGREIRIRENKVGLLLLSTSEENSEGIEKIRNAAKLLFTDGALGYPTRNVVRAAIENAEIFNASLLEPLRPVETERADVAAVESQV